MKERPSIYDWPAMARDLIEQASQNPHYETSDHLPIMGMFARDGMPGVIITCTLDVHSGGEEILHISFINTGKEPMSMEHTDEILRLFDMTDPLCFSSITDKLHFLYPFSSEDKAAHEWLKNFIIEGIHKRPDGTAHSAAHEYYRNMLNPT